MPIDWFTVGAQALNFLVLVWLLTRFLYRPILEAIEAREKRIAKELADAEEIRAQARKERDEFQRRSAELDEQRAALLSQSAREAKAEGERLLEQARQAANVLSTRRAEALRTEARNLNQAVTRSIQHEVFAIARKTLADLASAGLEQHLTEVFTRRVRELDGAKKIALGEALRTMTEPARLRSAFDLPAAQRAAIQAALREAFAADVRLRFETAPDLVSGIELSTDGQKVAWSIADYLDSLETSVEQLLGAGGKSQALEG